MDKPRKDDDLDSKNIQKSRQNQPNLPEDANNTNAAAATMYQSNYLFLTTDKLSFKSIVQYHTTHWSVREDNLSPSQNLSPPQPHLPQVPQQSMMSQGDQFEFNFDNLHVTNTMPSPNFNHPHGGVPSHDQYNAFGQTNAPTSQFLPPYPTCDPNMFTSRPSEFQNPPPTIPNFSASQRAQSDPSQLLPPPCSSPLESKLFKTPSWEY